MFHTNIYELLSSGFQEKRKEKRQLPRLDSFLSYIAYGVQAQNKYSRGNSV